MDNITKLKINDILDKIVKVDQYDLNRTNVKSFSMLVKSNPNAIRYSIQFLWDRFVKLTGVIPVVKSKANNMKRIYCEYFLIWKMCIYILNHSAVGLSFIVEHQHLYEVVQILLYLKRVCVGVKDRAELDNIKCLIGLVFNDLHEIKRKNLDEKVLELACKQLEREKIMNFESQRPFNNRIQLENRARSIESSFTRCIEKAEYLWAAYIKKDDSDKIENIVFDEIELGCDGTLLESSNMADDKFSIDCEVYGSDKFLNKNVDLEGKGLANFDGLMRVEKPDGNHRITTANGNDTEVGIDLSTSFSIPQTATMSKKNFQISEVRELICQLKKIKDELEAQDMDAIIREYLGVSWIQNSTEKVKSWICTLESIDEYDELQTANSFCVNKAGQLEIDIPATKCKDF